MTRLWLGEFFSLLSALCLAYSTFGRNKNKMLTWQTVNAVFYSLSNICLGGYSAVATNLLTVLRNVLQIKGKLTVPVTAAICAMMTGFSLSLNTRGWIGVLPVTASVLYTVMVYGVRSVRGMHGAVLLNMAQWAVFDGAVRAYPSLCIDVVMVCLSLFHLFVRPEKAAKP